jgi:hypothetical protein
VIGVFGAGLADRLKWAKWAKWALSAANAGGRANALLLYPGPPKLTEGRLAAIDNVERLNLPCLASHSRHTTSFYGIATSLIHNHNGKHNRKEDFASGRLSG